MRASVAGVEVRAPHVSRAEGGIDNPTVCQQPHSRATVHKEGDRVEHEKSLKVVEDKWIHVSAPGMPIITSFNVNKNEHRHLIADVVFSFNLLVAEPFTRTHRKQIPKARAACDK